MQYQSNLFYESLNVPMSGYWLSQVFLFLEACLSVYVCKLCYDVVHDASVLDKLSALLWSLGAMVCS